MASPPRASWLNLNTLLALAGLCLSAAVFYASRDYPRVPLEIGGSPGLYPRILAVMLAVLSGITLIEGLLRPVQAAFPKGITLVRLLSLMVLLATTPFALGLLGFRLMGTLLVLGAMLLLSDWGKLDVKTLLLYVLVALGVTFALYFVLESVARVPLPRGRLF